MSEIHTEPFSPLPIEKFERIVTACSAHRPWFDDVIWDDPQTRREAVIAHLSDAHNYGKLFEVWKGESLLGIILLNELVPFRDVRCHFIFFDSKLSDKRQLCLNVMGWCFTQLPVEVLRVEIPTYATALVKFALRSLGFRYEAERKIVVERPTAIGKARQCYAALHWSLSQLPVRVSDPQYFEKSAALFLGTIRNAMTELETRRDGHSFRWPNHTAPLPAELAALGSRKHHATQYKGVWHDLLLLSVTQDEFVAFCREQNSDGHESQASQSGESAGTHTAGDGSPH